VEKGEQKALSDPAGAQPARRVGRRANFFIFFGRNPLKRLDSEKLMKINESKRKRILLSFVFHLLAANSRPGCIAMTPPRRRGLMG
jgi:hypothetical protein